MQICSLTLEQFLPAPWAGKHAYLILETQNNIGWCTWNCNWSTCTAGIIDTKSTPQPRAYCYHYVFQDYKTSLMNHMMDSVFPYSSEGKLFEWKWIIFWYWQHWYLEYRNQSRKIVTKNNCHNPRRITKLVIIEWNVYLSIKNTTNETWRG